MEIESLIDNLLAEKEPEPRAQFCKQVLAHPSAQSIDWNNRVLPHLRNRLDAALSKEADLSRPNVEENSLGEILGRWNELGIAAEVAGRSGLADAAFREMLSTLRAAQGRLGHLHKGTPLHELGWIRIRQLEDRELATPYFLAALVEDAMRDPEGFRYGPAASVLTQALGRDDELFDAVLDFVKSREGLPEPLRGISELDPELLALAASMQHRSGSELHQISLHFDPALGELLLGPLSPTSEKTGQRLELLTAYLMRTLGGFDTRGRVETIDGEHDLIMRNRGTENAILGDYVLVECKDWKDRVGAAEIKKFAANVSAASCHTGILVSREGITGTPSSDAHYSIRREYHRNGAILISLCLDDLKSLINRQVDLPDLLLTKYEETRFDERSAGTST